MKFQENKNVHSQLKGDQVRNGLNIENMSEDPGVCLCW